MSIATYDDLQSKITSWLKRPDLADQVVDFIELAEAHFNRVIRSPEMEVRSQLVADAEFSGLPSDYLGMREIHMETAPDKPLKYFSPQELTIRDFENHTGTPYGYSIVDQQLKLYPSPDATNTAAVEMIYISKIAALSDSNTTNWLLTAHPDIYLYGSMMQAEGFLYNDKRMPIWERNRDLAINRVNQLGIRSNVGAGPLQPRVGAYV